jgi:hypothetical protein
MDLTNEKLIANSMDPDQTARMQTHFFGFVMARLNYRHENPTMLTLEDCTHLQTLFKPAEFVKFLKLVGHNWFSLHGF